MLGAFQSIQSKLLFINYLILSDTEVCRLKPIILVRLLYESIAVNQQVRTCNIAHFKRKLSVVVLRVGQRIRVKKPILYTR